MSCPLLISRKQTHFSMNSGIFIQLRNNLLKRIKVVGDNVMSLTIQKWLKNMICISLVIMSENLIFFSQTKEEIQTNMTH